MTEFKITLPQNCKLGMPKVFEGRGVLNDVEVALSMFDTDGKKGLNDKELSVAFDYFVNKEKEISINGKKGDGEITSEDLLEILKTDSMFSHLQKTYEDNKSLELLKNTVLTLSALVGLKSVANDAKVLEYINTSTIRFMDNSYASRNYPVGELVTYTQSKTVQIEGKIVKICENSKGGTYVISENGESIYTDPDFVAKCLGYDKERHLFTSDKYYVRDYVSGHVCGKNISDECKQYKVWDENTNTFVDGELKRTGSRVVSLINAR